ncbi:MAG TPA: hypothetical protein VN793_02380 [Acidimicrobiales bacterium]|nr:hypothetical protein [Acidimicrobiales bacterium]
MSTPRRSGATAAEEQPEEHRSSGDRRWRLEDQRDFLVRSLADLQAEHDAGDIEARDYDALVARDRGRLSAVEAELRELDAEEAAAPVPAATGRPRRRTRGDGRDPAPGAPAQRRRPIWLGVVAIVALTAGTTLLVVHLASPRLPGQPETGGATQNLAQEVQTQLAEATVLVDEGTQSSLSQALIVYRTVLSEDPNQPQALAETGWLVWEAGFSGGDATLESQGKALVQRSVTVERNDFAAHLFLGTIELKQDHDPAAAVTQYKAFLSEHPPKARITSAAPLIRQAFGDLGQPVPAAVGG